VVPRHRKDDLLSISRRRRCCAPRMSARAALQLPPRARSAAACGYLSLPRTITHLVIMLTTTQNVVRHDRRHRRHWGRVLLRVRSRKGQLSAKARDLLRDVSRIRP